MSTLQREVSILRNLPQIYEGTSQIQRLIVAREILSNPSVVTP